MVREAIVSAATLAGLVGLACLYHNGGSTVDLARSERIARAADLFDQVFDDFAIDDNATADQDFFADFDLSIDDVGQFQNADDKPDQRAGGAKKQIAQVKNCLRNAACTQKAQKAVKTWAINSANYIEANPSRLLKPVNSGVQETEEGFENDFGLCTPHDDGVPCSADQDIMFNYNANNNEDPNQYSANADVQSAIEALLPESQAMSDALQSMAVGEKDYRNKDNAFSARAAKIFLIIPNGVPVSMPDSYTYRFGNYWRWFKSFNENYIGAGVPRGANRVNFHFWFLRQDKNLKMVMRNPAKSTNRFPWKRFDSVMLPNQNTAAQPKIANTFSTLHEVIGDKGFAADFPEGQDCFTLWFHQYIPQDILDLSDSLFQEEVVKPVEKTCTIIHVWVGAQALEGDDKTAKVVQYIQGLLQPEQLSSTSVDPQNRRYYFVDSLQALMGPQGKQLQSQIYNDIALERKRATCLLSTGASDLGAAFEAANDRYDEYYGYGDSTTTANDYALATDGSLIEDYGLEYENDATTTAMPEADAFTTTAGVPDYKCCGIGFAGTQYDANSQACCDDGTIADSEADCFLL